REYAGILPYRFFDRGGAHGPRAFPTAYILSECRRFWRVASHRKIVIGTSHVLFYQRVYGKGRRYRNGRKNADRHPFSRLRCSISTPTPQALCDHANAKVNAAYRYPCLACEYRLDCVALWGGAKNSSNAYPTVGSRCTGWSTR